MELKAIDELLKDELLQTFQEHLSAIIRYGELKLESKEVRYCEYLIIFYNLNTNILNNLQPLITKFNPLGARMRIRSHEEFRSSADIFPDFYLELKQNHEIIFGKNELKSIQVDDENLRLSLEFQIRQLAIQFRRAYLRSKGEEKKYRLLLKKGFNELLYIIKYLMVLEGKLKDLSIQKSEIINLAVKEYQLNHKILSEIEAGPRNKNVDLSSRLADLLLLIHEVEAFTDKLRV